MVKTIEIIVSPQGQTTLQTRGFAGIGCREASKALEQALGLVESDQVTAELYRTQEAGQTLRQSSGS